PRIPRLRLGIVLPRPAGPAERDLPRRPVGAAKRQGKLPQVEGRRGGVRRQPGARLGDRRQPRSAQRRSGRSAGHDGAALGFAAAPQGARLRNRYFCSPLSTSSSLWLWTVTAIVTTPVVRCGSSAATASPG